MDNNIEIVKSLYSVDGYAIENMKEYTKKGLENGLKKWENEVVPLFPAKSLVLNIGCGMGREAFCLFDMGFTVTAIDISEKVIETAKDIAVKTNRHVEFLITNGFDIPFGDGCFDVVIMWAQTFGCFMDRKTNGESYKSATVF